MSAHHWELQSFIQMLFHALFWSPSLFLFFIIIFKRERERYIHYLKGSNSCTLVFLFVFCSYLSLLRADDKFWSQIFSKMRTLYQNRTEVSENWMRGLYIWNLNQNLQALDIQTCTVLWIEFVMKLEKDKKKGAGRLGSLLKLGQWVRREKVKTVMQFPQELLLGGSAATSKQTVLRALNRSGSEGKERYYWRKHTEKASEEVWIGLVFITPRLWVEHRGLFR